MTWSMRLKRSMSAVGWLFLPLSVPAESDLSDNGPRATAHLMFKIVVPQVLSVDAGQMLSIGGNHQSVFQLATGGSATERHQIILISSGHRSVVQFADCSRTEASRGNPTMSCTVSMP